MTTLLRSTSVAAIEPRTTTTTTGIVRRLRSALRRRLPSLAWFAPVALIGVLLRLINLGGAPQRIDDEGTYVAQAYAVQHFGELAHYTYWYDHPPLGWLQIAAWTSLTGAFERWDSAVLAGRELMVLAHLVSLAMLWLLARRLGFSRPAAAATLLVLAASPLAIQFQRTVFLDNLATPWLLAALVLGLNRRGQLAAFAGAALCFGIAVLTKETYLLFLPLLGWLVWRGAHKGTRRYTVSLSAGLLVLIGLSYLLLATIKGEMLPGQDRVSLWNGITYQLVRRDGSGSIFDPASLSGITVGQWLQLDPVLPIAATLGALIGLTDRRLRPFAVTLLALLLFMLRPGYLPVPYVIALLPFAALAVVGGARALVSAARRRRRAVTRVLAGGLTAALLLGGAGAAGVSWYPQWRGLLLADLDLPMRQAQSWVAANVDRDYRLVVDDAMWVDLQRAGFDRRDVVWYYKVDTDPEVAALAPNGWRDYDYVITTNSMRTFPDGFPIVRQALDNSEVVASFGTGERAVIVQRVHPEGATVAEEQEARDATARTTAGRQLATNPGLQLDPADRDLLTGGQVDARVLIGATLAAPTAELTVAGFPVVAGEEDRPRRQLLISAIDGRAATEASPTRQNLIDLLQSQAAPYAPRSITSTDQGLLITWNVDAPSGLLGR